MANHGSTLNTANFWGGHNSGSQIGQNYGSVNFFQHGPSAEQQCLQAFRLPKEYGGQPYEWYKYRTENRLPGTCEWFLSHIKYMGWKQSVSGPLLVSADPGCGKSVLAKYLIDHELTGTVCYFFFKEQDQDTIVQALCALLHQMFVQKHNLLKHAIPRYQIDGPELMRNVVQLTEIFKSAVRDPEAGPVTIVMDGLDECNVPDQKEIVSLLTAVLQYGISEGAQFKVLLTTRPYQEIINKFLLLAQDFPEIRIPGENSSVEISKEVKVVIEHRVKELARKFQLRDELRLKLLETLLGVTHRTYLWVYLVFDHLDRGFKKTPKGIEEVIENLPKTRDAAYEKIFERSTDQAKARLTLSVMLVARTPLTLDEMNVVMAIESSQSPRTLKDLILDDDEEFDRTIRDWCGFFISIDDNKLYFLHQTAREFLLTNYLPETLPSREWRWRGSLDERHAHARLAKICLTFLSLKEIKTNGPAVEESLDRFNFDYAWKNDALVREFSSRPFSVYAASHWVAHFHGANPQRRAEASELLSLIRQLFDFEYPNVPTWAYLAFPRNESRRLKLHLALLTGIDELFLELITMENFDLPDQLGQTPLFYVAQAKRNDLLTALVGLGADIWRTNRLGRNVLFFLIRQRHGTKRIETVRHLVELGADMEQKSATGRPLLHHVIESADSSAAQLLIDLGADVNSRDRRGRTALFSIIQTFPHGLYENLNRSAASLETQNSTGETPLPQSNWTHAACLFLLLNNGLSVDARDNDGRTPLHMAAKTANSELVEILLKLNANGNVCDVKGLTALDYVVRGKWRLEPRKWIVEALIRHGVRGSPALAWKLTRFVSAQRIRELSNEVGHAQPWLSELVDIVQESSEPAPMAQWSSDSPEPDSDDTYIYMITRSSESDDMLQESSESDDMV